MIMYHKRVSESLLHMMFWGLPLGNQTAGGLPPCPTPFFRRVSCYAAERVGRRRSSDHPHIHAIDESNAELKDGYARGTTFIRGVSGGEQRERRS